MGTGLDMAVAYDFELAVIDRATYCRQYFLTNQYRYCTLIHVNATIFGHQDHYVFQYPSSMSEIQVGNNWINISVARGMAFSEFSLRMSPGSKLYYAF